MTLLHRHLLYCLLALLLLPGCRAEDSAPAAYLTAIPDPKTLGETYVTDPDHVLSPATVQALNDQLRTLDQAGRAHIDVALTKSIGEAVPKTAATELFNRWKIGDKEKDNGLLMLLVIDQHRIEFETGYGLEADLPDALCYRIQQQHMISAARAGNYDQAVTQGVAAIIRQLNGASITDGSTAGLALTDGDASGILVDSAISPGPDLVVESPDAVADDYAAPTREQPSIWVLGVLGTLFLGLYGVIAGLTTQGRPCRWLLIIGLLVVPIGVVLYLLGFSPVPMSNLQFAGLLYAFPLVYLHLYFLGVYRTWAAKYQSQSRHAQYIYLEQAHHGLGFTAKLFPLFLAFYWPWVRRSLEHLRHDPYACPSCANPMHLLDEQTDDALLQPGQVAEETVASVDYDVWQCGQCQHTLTLSYPNLSTTAVACKKCHNLTAMPQPDQVVESATTSSEGWGWHVHKCAFCQHVEKEKYTIARISTSSSSSSSGSSSSSSSSSSSGGSSGGGGAGSSW